MKRKSHIKLEISTSEEYFPLIEENYAMPIELKQLELKQKDLLTNTQKAEIISLINQNNISLLIDSLKEKNFNLKALEFGLQHSTNPEIFNILENAYLNKKIGKLKNRPLKIIREKTEAEGSTLGNFVTKLNEKDEIKSKHHNIWIQKKQTIKGKNIGEEICEYIGSNLMNYIMGDNSPKVRLHKDEENNISIISKFIPNFTTLSNQDTHKIKNALNHVKERARFFAANILLADYDTNLGNIGIRIDDNGESNLARIDNGKALSYKIVRKTPDSKTFSDTPSDIPANIIKNNIFRDPIFKKDLFKGEDFGSELIEICDNLNINSIKKIINLSLNNIEKAYGKNIFSNPSVVEELKNRIEFDSQSISRQDLENAIINNIALLIPELKTIASNEIRNDKENITLDCINITSSPERTFVKKLKDERSNYKTQENKKIN